MSVSDYVINTYGHCCFYYALDKVQKIQYFIYVNDRHKLRFRMRRDDDARYSSFWMDDAEFRFNKVKSVDMWDTESLLKYAAFKRAIANFVRILTGKDIPVKYSIGGDSYTDGTSVTLSSKLEDNLFDTTVGVALHEGSHIVHSDFVLSKVLQFLVYYMGREFPNITLDDAELEFNSNFDYSTRNTEKRKKEDETIKRVLDSYFDSLVNLVTKMQSVHASTWNVFRRNELIKRRNELFKRMHLMYNWIEDRRIDYRSFSTSPGYRGYYNAMYKTYFFDKLVGKALRASNYARTETWDSYKFRIINLMNPSADLDALKGLREISDIIDVPNIGRLTDSYGSWSLAFKVMDIIYSNLVVDSPAETEKKESMDEAETNPETSDSSDDDGNRSSSTNDDGEDDNDDGGDDGDGEDEEDGDEGGEDDEDGDGSGTESDDKSDEDMSDSKSSDGDATDTDDEKKSTLSDTDFKKMEKMEKKQSDFVNGELDKGKMSKTMATAVNAMDNGGVTMKSVGTSFLDSRGRPFKIQCVVVDRVTDELLDSHVFKNTFVPTTYPDTYLWDKIDAIEKGVRLGRLLGKKLQIRNESRETRYTHLDSGRIDKRLLSGLMYKNVNVFFRTMVDTYDPLTLHISVDASGSMDGKKWLDSVVMMTAIAQAASMTSNLHVVITIRTTVHGVNTRQTGRRRFRETTVKTSQGYAISERPFIATLYDSRVDKMMHLTHVLKYTKAGGYTPEGLAFETIMDSMVAGKKGQMKSVFLNISDGQPYFNADVAVDGKKEHFHYHSESAAKHTNALISQMENMGIKVLSYFVYDQSSLYGVSRIEDTTDWKVFKQSYTKNAFIISANNLVDIARTLNGKFLEK